MIDYFPKLASEIGSAIRETAVDLFDAGVQFLQSLWKGMKSKLRAIASWAGSIPSRIGGAVKGALGFCGLHERAPDANLGYYVMKLICYERTVWRREWDSNPR